MVELWHCFAPVVIYLTSHAHGDDLPEETLNKRALSIDYPAGGFNVNANPNSFLTLDDNFAAFFQPDGNFVVKQDNVMVWAAGTNKYDCNALTNCLLTLQSDGNLVIYVNGAAVWQLNTIGATSMTFASDRYARYFISVQGPRGVLWESKDNGPQPRNPCSGEDCGYCPGCQPGYNPVIPGTVVYPGETPSIHPGRALPTDNAEE